MPAGPMHPDEVETDVLLVRRLLAAQFPQWSEQHTNPMIAGGSRRTIDTVLADHAHGA